MYIEEKLNRPEGLSMARLAGVEPATCPLGGGRSIQVSYKRII